MSDTGVACRMSFKPSENLPIFLSFYRGLKLNTLFYMLSTNNKRLKTLKIIKQGNWYRSFHYVSSRIFFLILRLTFHYVSSRIFFLILRQLLINQFGLRKKTIFRTSIVNIFFYLHQSNLPSSSSSPLIKPPLLKKNETFGHKV